MRVLAFDGRTGAAGDVIVGALVAAGADPAELRVVEDHLPVGYEFDDVTEQGVAGVQARVYHTGDANDEDTSDTTDESDERTHAEHADDEHGSHTHDAEHGSHPSGGDGHAHDADHASDEHGGHTHDASDGHTHGETDAHDAEGAGSTRSYAEVREIVASMDLPTEVERDALAVFETLGAAEAAVHDTPLAETAFHEVGTDDAIADVVGAAILVADLDPDRIVTTPVAVGGGEVTFSHGTYPVPTPAVTRVAERTGLTTVGGPVDRELLTPTGAAILGTLADSVDRLPALSVEHAGYGVGAYDLDDRPNVLRATVGERAERADSGADDERHAGGESDETTDHESHAGSESTDSAHDEGTERLTHDDIAVLETNLDDATPEVLGSLQETLLDAGAKDVTILPATMKKSRPGHLVKVICAPSDARRLARRLAVETGTLGVRQTGASHRWIADRSVRSVTVAADGEDHEVRVKIATDGEEVYDVSGEYDDALAVSEATDVPVREVLRRAERAARE